MIMSIIKDTHSLESHKASIREVFNKKGTKAARKYVYSRFMIKLTGREVRNFLNVPGYNHRLAMGVKELAWKVCGWAETKYEAR